MAKNPDLERGDSSLGRSDSTARQVESDLLAQIGRCLFEQDLRVRVQVPAALATAALAAWDRDDEDEIGRESAEERSVRFQAGALALIGLAIEQRGHLDEGGQVEVELDAWQIGNALDAADQRGMLRSPPPAGGKEVDP